MRTTPEIVGWIRSVRSGHTIPQSMRRQNRRRPLEPGALTPAAGSAERMRERCAPTDRRSSSESPLWRARARRCARTAGTSSVTSSGRTKSRPFTRALAWAAVRRAIPPRTLTPALNSVSVRVAATIRRMKSRMLSSTKTWGTSAWRAQTSSRDADGVERDRVVAAPRAAQDLDLVVVLGIAHAQAHEEAVHLALRAAGTCPRSPPGFWVAKTMKGDPTACDFPSTVTLARSITSRSADCVFGGARLISSARTMFAKTGPRLKTNSFVDSS
jgi:hypothetical protein